jgi:hypothetical protein
VPLNFNIHGAPRMEAEKGSVLGYLLKALFVFNEARLNVILSPCVHSTLQFPKVLGIILYLYSISQFKKTFSYFGPTNVECGKQRHRCTD